MKFKEYLEKLNKLAQNHPEIADFTVVSAKDDEGNGFNKVHYDPSIGVFDGWDYMSTRNAEDGDEEIAPNAVCLN